MPMYDYKCPCGVRFEALAATRDSPNPACPACGSAPRRLPASGVVVLGRAGLPASARSAPASWEGTYRGNREYVAQWRRTLDERARLEERYPELADNRPTVVAHEGPFHEAPLTTDDLAAAGHAGTPAPAAKAHPHAHPHSHPHGVTASTGDARPASGEPASGTPATGTPATGTKRS